jgi:hypothetical protein
MTLRRLADQIRDHNWFVVAIEFLIVALSVFLGLQASNWNEARIDRAIAAGHLAEIAEDLQAHLDFNERLYGSAVARISAADYLLREAGRATPPPSVVVSTRRTTPSFPVSIRSAPANWAATATSSRRLVPPTSAIPPLLR